MVKTNLFFMLALSTALTGVGTAAFADAQASAPEAAPNAKPIETLVIMGQRTPVTTAREVQETAPNLVNILPVVEIRKLPDVNAGEAVRRVPGISLETDTGEGRFVNIRGLDADLTSTTFGGVRLPPSNVATPFGGGRAVAFDSIPAGLIGAITVTKTNTPDQDAEALGGTIEITPKTVPASGEPFIEGKLGTGLEPLRNTSIFDGELTLGGKFGGDEHTDPASRPFSFIATVTQYNDRRGLDDLEASYQDNQAGGVPDKAFSSLEQRYYRYHRQRFGYGAEIGYQPDPQNSWYFRYNEAGYDDTVHRQRLLYNNLDNGNGVTDAFGNTLLSWLPDPSNPKGFIAPAAQYQKTLRDDLEQIDSRVFSFGGKNVFSDMLLDYHGSFSQGSFYKPYDYNSTFTNGTTGILAYDNTTNPDFPTVRPLAGPNPVDPNGYVLTKFSNSTEKDRDKEWGGAANLTIPTAFLGTDEDVKIGASLRLRDRINRVFSYSYSSVPSVPLTSVLSSGNITYYEGHYQNGPDINNIAMRKLFYANPSLFPEQILVDLATDLTGQSHDTENIYAGYGQYRVTLGQLAVLAGIRFEQTDAVYEANQVATDSNGNLIGYQPISQSSRYFNYFPTVQFRYAFVPKLIGRLSYSTAIARPGFTQVTAATSINPAGDFVSQGNPNLKPTTGDNFDASLEYYLPKGGIASAGFFDKELHNYILNKVQTGVFFPNNGLFAGFVGAAKVFTFGNVPSARAYGFELNYQQRFIDLPGFWNGFGIDGNYTHVESSIEIRPGEHGLLPSTSPDTYNTALFYEKYGVALRLGVSFVGENLWGVGGSSATDIWSQDRLNVDFGATYAVTENVDYYFNAKNLTNTPLKFTEGKGPNRPIQREFYDTTLQTGVRFSF